jgi:hypothetical protein
MHLIGWLREDVDDQTAYRAAFAGGVEVTPLSAYCIEPRKPGALRLGYTGYNPRQSGARRGSWLDYYKVSNSIGKLTNHCLALSDVHV